ncbi:DUF4145 domain-containing protein [Shewanella oncorhynchi]|uniref:DUF4145 domain-containing protein n=1 Tax=Shewanella oncorhynchi TaxID=2726434 RepID=UPI0039F08551
MNFEEYMKYINHRFTIRVFQNQFPKDYRCSCCGDGVLGFVSDKFHKHETLKSVKWHQDEGWGPEWIEYIFTASLQCQSCSEFYIVSGTGAVVEEWDQEEGCIHYDVFFPKFFLPTIHIFSIPRQTPVEVSDIIESSFSLAWSDYSAAGNKLRVALELIVAELVPNSGQTLGNKINEIPEEKAGIREMLKAIKWLGNQGSHEAKLAEYDLAFSFKVIEKVLNTLYPNPDDTESLMTHVQMVNQAKGSIAK